MLQKIYYDTLIIKVSYLSKPFFLLRLLGIEKPAVKIEEFSIDRMIILEHVESIDQLAIKEFEGMLRSRYGGDANYQVLSVNGQELGYNMMPVRISHRLDIMQKGKGLEPEKKDLSDYGGYSLKDAVAAGLKVVELATEPKKYLTGIDLIARERKNQIGVLLELDELGINEGWSKAAACYALPHLDRTKYQSLHRPTGQWFPRYWPSHWSLNLWKPEPENRMRELATAGAFIVAELDRILKYNGQELVHENTLIDDKPDTSGKMLLLSSAIDDWCYKALGNNTNALETANRMYKAAKAAYYANSENPD